MEWANRIEGTERDYIEIEYKVKIDTLRPDLKVEDSGNIEDLPEGYDAYLVDEWLIEPTMPEIVELATLLSNGTDGNVIKIPKNIYTYIMQKQSMFSYFISCFILLQTYSCCNN